MDESGKRRRDSSTSSDSSRTRICVVHFKDCNSKVFTYLSDTKDPDQRLKKLQEILLVAIIVFIVLASRKVHQRHDTVLQPYNLNKTTD